MAGEGRQEATIPSGARAISANAAPLSGAEDRWGTKSLYLPRNSPAEVTHVQTSDRETLGRAGNHQGRNRGFYQERLLGSDAGLGLFERVGVCWAEGAFREEGKT